MFKTNGVLLSMQETRYFNDIGSNSKNVVTVTFISDAVVASHIISAYRGIALVITIYLVFSFN